MTITGNKIQTKKSIQDLSAILSTPEGFKKILPDNLKSFNIKDEDSFSFQLDGGMPEISLKIAERNTNKIVFDPLKDSMNFSLTLDINENESTSDAQFLFSGKFNTLISMMVEKPLTKFIDTISNNIEKI